MSQKRSIVEQNSVCSYCESLNQQQVGKTVQQIDEMLKFIDENVENLKHAFSSFDHKGVGTIPANRLGNLIRSLGFNPTEDDMIYLIHNADIDSNGVIDFIEFLELMQRIWGGDSETIREAFQIFDSDGSGKIDRDEFMSTMKCYSDLFFNADEVSEMVRSVDLDGDGHIDLEEFVRMLKS